MTRGPLTGLRVVDAARVLAGPYLAMLLADLGADVVKVEKPVAGDQTRGWGPPWVGRRQRGAARTSAYFASANRGKRSLALDLKQPAGREVFSRLVARADVLVENFLPGEWRQLGFRRRDWTRLHPRLVQCTVSGYGPGADTDRPAYDIVLQAESGLMAITGYPHPAGLPLEPVRVGVAIVDLVTALYGLNGLLAALFARARSGRGRRVEVPMADAATAFLSYAGQSFLADRREPERLGSRHPNLAPYQAVRTKDGWLVVGIGGDAAWRRLCAALANPALATDPRFATNEARLRHRTALDRALARAFRSRPNESWLPTLRAHRIPAGPVRALGAALADARARGQIETLAAGAYGSLPTIAPPWLFDANRLPASRPVPALGEHSDAVLREAGLRKKEIATLRSEGVVS